MALKQEMKALGMKTLCKGKPLALFLYLLCVSIGVTLTAKPIEFSILEELPPGNIVGNIRDSSDLSSQYPDEVLASLRFSFRQSDSFYRYFSLDQMTGLMRTTRRLDREKLCPGQIASTTASSTGLTDHCLISLDVTVTPNQYFQILKVNVRVLDANDNAPTFPVARVTVEIPENSPVGSSFSLPSATDADSGSLGIQTYILDSDTPDMFQLVLRSLFDGTKEIRLSLVKQLDRETNSKYKLTVRAIDGGEPVKSGSLEIDVVVSDSNDNLPLFDQQSYEVEVLESVPVGTTIARVHATDVDEGLNGDVQYGFTDYTESSFGMDFGIHSATGELFIKRQLDFERQALYQLTVVATDLGPGAMPAFAKVTINVLDVNDNSPIITLNSLTTSGRVEVSENSDPGAFVAYVSVKDSDSNKNGQVDCILDSSLDSIFRLEPFYGTEFKLTTRISFDREEASRYNVFLTCSDKGSPPRSSELTIVVHILDENDNPPIIHSRDPVIVEQFENNSEGQLIGVINATDSDVGPNGALVFHLDPLNEESIGAVRIDRSNGRLYAGLAFDYEKQQEYRYTLSVSDQGEGEGQLPNLTRMTLIVRVKDTNDCTPRFERIAYYFKIEEGLPSGTTVGRIHATDDDLSPVFSRVYYEIRPQTSWGAAAGSLQIDQHSGILTTSRPIDREESSRFDFIVIAYNEALSPASPRVERSVNVSVEIEDVNDNAPLVRYPAGADSSVQISSRASVGSLVTRIDAVDSDAGANAWLIYNISNGNELGMFTIDQHTGAVTVAKTIGQVQDVGSDGVMVQSVIPKSFHLVITVRDRGSPELTTAIDLIISINSTMDSNAILSLDARKGSGADGKLPEGERFMIIAGIASSFFVVLIIIIVVIVVALVMARRRRRREAKRRDWMNGSGFGSIRSCSSWKDAHSLGGGSCSGSLSKCKYASPDCGVHSGTDRDDDSDIDDMMLKNKNNCSKKEARRGEEDGRQSRGSFSSRRSGHSTSGCGGSGSACGTARRSGEPRPDRAPLPECSTLLSPSRSSSMRSGAELRLSPARSMPQVHCQRCRHRHHSGGSRRAPGRGRFPRSSSGGIRNSRRRQGDRGYRSDMEMGGHRRGRRERESESECSGSYVDSGMDPSEDSDNHVNKSSS